MKTYRFTGGNTAPETFPVEGLIQAAEKGISQVGTGFISYPGELGHQGLREVMAQREMDREGVEVSPDHIALTNGSMQAVTLMAETFMKGPGDIVVMEELTYMGTIGAYKRLGAQLVGIPMDNDGMKIDKLEETLERLHAKNTPPAFIYTIPTYHNPTGIVMSKERRLQLIDIARHFNTIVVEDNCYGDVHYEGEKPSALYALDDNPRHIYICSLSKILGPGVRQGYFYARPPYLEKILDRRYDGGCSLLSGSILAAYFKGNLWHHCQMTNALLKEKRDATMDALQRNLGDICSWTHPVGGLFIWVKFPDDVDQSALDTLLAERQFIHSPGRILHVEGKDIPYLRLSFGAVPIDDIPEGIAVLGDCIRTVRNLEPAVSAS